MVFGRVGTVIEAVQLDFVFAEQVDHAPVAGVHFVRRAHVASYEGLVADDDKLESAHDKHLQRVNAAVNKFDPGRILEVRERGE